MLGSLVSCCGLIKLRKNFQGYVWVSRYLRDVENLGLCCQSFKEHGLAYCLCLHSDHLQYDLPMSGVFSIANMSIL